MGGISLGPDGGVKAHDRAAYLPREVYNTKDSLAGKTGAGTGTWPGGESRVRRVCLHRLVAPPDDAGPARTRRAGRRHGGPAADTGGAVPGDDRHAAGGKLLP